MHTTSAIFITLSFSLVIAIYGSSSNSVSAASECFGEGSLDHVFCVTTLGQPPNTQTHVFECLKDKDGRWDCHGITKKATPPGIDQLIQNTINEVGPSTTNDPKDLGGIKSDKGITKSPIE